MAVAKCDTHPVNAMLVVSDVLNNRRLALLYTRILQRDNATVDEIARSLDSSSTTVYEDIHKLTEAGLLDCVTERQPHRYRASPVSVTVQAAEESYEITPTLIAAVAHSTENQNLDVYLDRHGISGLATATEYARAYVKGKMTSRIMARELDISVLEAETILQELREIILSVEPDLEEEVDLDELDSMVGVVDDDESE
jgi:DNA-binding transcriptional ArsR family regulator